MRKLPLSGGCIRCTVVHPVNYQYLIELSIHIIEGTLTSNEVLKNYSCITCRIQKPSLCVITVVSSLLLIQTKKEEIGVVCDCEIFEVFDVFDGKGHI